MFRIISDYNSIIITSYFNNLLYLIYLMVFDNFLSLFEVANRVMLLSALSALSY